MPSFEFDGDNKLIYLLSGSTDVSVKNDLYSDWKEWVQIGDNAKYLDAFRTVGGDPIDDTTDLGDTYFLENGWRIRPHDGNYTLIVRGNLYTAEGSGSYIPATGSNSNVTILSSVSNLIQTIATGDANADVIAV